MADAQSHLFRDFAKVESLVIEWNGGGHHFDLSWGQMDWIVFPLLEGAKLETVLVPGGLIKGSYLQRAFPVAH